MLLLWRLLAAAAAVAAALQGTTPFRFHLFSGERDTVSLHRVTQLADAEMEYRDDGG